MQISLLSISDHLYLARLTVLASIYAMEMISCFPSGEWQTLTSCLGSDRGAQRLEALPRPA
jgi:hypothetical protein